MVSVETLVPILGAKLFSDNDILKLCEKKVNILLYSDLKKYRTLHDALYPHGAAVILYEREPGVGHWCALIEHPNKIFEFFDSLAGPVDGALARISPSMNKKLGQTSKQLLKMIKQDIKSGEILEVITAKKPLQSDKSLVNTCGRWCGLRIAMRQLPLSQFLALFNKVPHKPDWYAIALTLFV